MDVKDVIEEVESSAKFKSFIKEHPKHYLVHLFAVLDPLHTHEWQLGYYSKETDRIVVFEYKDDGSIDIMPPQEAFKQENYIQPLNISKIKVSKEDAVKTFGKLVKEHYSAESLNKVIMLLQNLPEYGQLWNITIVTATFNVINVKINAETGQLIKHTKESLLGWKRE